MPARFILPLSLVSSSFLILAGVNVLPALATGGLTHATEEISGGAEMSILAEQFGAAKPSRVGALLSHPGNGALAPQIPVPPIGFDAFDFDDNIVQTGGFLTIPPDPMGVAGTDRVIAIGNIVIEARDKQGNLIWIDALKDFFVSLFGGSPGSLGTLTFDPKITYDTYEDRFVVVALERQFGAPTDESRILVAVSKTGTPATSTTLDWNYLAIDSKIKIGGFDHWVDYPGFEVDEEAIYITTNMIPFGAGSGGVRLWIIDKGTAAGFYGGGAAAFSVNDPIVGDALATTLMPAKVFAPAGIGPGIGTFLVGYSSLTFGGPGANEAVQVIRVDNPLGAVAFTAEFTVVGDIEDVGGAFGFPPLPDAPQSGSGTLIEVNDSRALDCVYRNGSIWITTTINPNSGPDAGETTAHWFRLNASSVINSGSPAGLITLADQGDIGGEDIAANTTTFFPSVAVNSLSEAKFGFSASADSIFAGAYVTGRQPADAAGTVQASEVVRTGDDFYVRTLGSGRNRWGDYSGISLDPIDDRVFWIFNEYAAARGTPTPTPPEDGRWGTAWARCAFTNIIAVDEPAGTASVVLHGSVPNPIQERSIIRFELPRSSRVSLRLYDVRGRLVQTALDGAQLEAGVHQWEWNARGSGGARVSTGVYFYELITGDVSLTKRLVVID